MADADDGPISSRLRKRTVVNYCELPRKKAVPANIPRNAGPSNLRQQTPYRAAVSSPVCPSRASSSDSDPYDIRTPSSSSDSSPERLSTSRVRVSFAQRPSTARVRVASAQLPSTARVRVSSAQRPSTARVRVASDQHSSTARVRVSLAPGLPQYSRPAVVRTIRQMSPIPPRRSQPIQVTLGRSTIRASNVALPRHSTPLPRVGNIRKSTYRRTPQRDSTGGVERGRLARRTSRGRNSKAQSLGNIREEVVQEVQQEPEVIVVEMVEAVTASVTVSEVQEVHVPAPEVEEVPVVVPIVQEEPVQSPQVHQPSPSPEVWHNQVRRAPRQKRSAPKVPRTKKAGPQLPIPPPEPEPEETPLELSTESFKPVMCAICMSDEAEQPVKCFYCNQPVGCLQCVYTWYTSKDRGQRNCPLCRHEWTGLTTNILPY